MKLNGKFEKHFGRNAGGSPARFRGDREAAGFQIGLHSIGDKANRIALDGFEKAVENKAEKRKDRLSNTNKTTEDTIARCGEKVSMSTGRMDLSYLHPCRHRIEHAQVVAPSDFKRFAELGVIASMQPSHAISDKRWAGDRLGEYRSLGAYSWHTFMANNVHVAFGTDAPVESLDTYQTLYAAVSRQDISGDPVNGWQPQEKLVIEDAIRSYTYESAYAEFAEQEKGTIEVGKFADLVVHSKDLLTIEHKEILETRPTHTIFNGKIVYEK